jgi:hypothetical protein
MLNTVLSDLWNSVDLLITLFIFTVAGGINLLFAFRVMYLVKKNEDPIKVFKKYEDNGTLRDVLINQKEYDEINGI